MSEKTQTKYFACRQAGSSSYQRACRGSALFELLLAVLIFGMAALALSGSLNQVGMLAIESKQIGRAHV